MSEHDGLAGRALGGREHAHLLEELHVLGLRDAGDGIHTGDKNKKKNKKKKKLSKLGRIG